MEKKSKKAAVLGAGVMGATIAAHLANVGIPSIMLDIVPKKLTPEEEKKGLDFQHPEVRNRFAMMGKQNLLRSRTAALALPEFASLIEVGNFEDHMARLTEVDWIIEVVVENLKIKQDLFKKVAAVRRPGTIVSSNTSGIPIKDMCAGMNLEFKEHFLGTHFFNDLVEMDMLYLAIAPGKEGHALHEHLLRQRPNQLPKLLPLAGEWASVLWVVDSAPANAGGSLFLNVDSMQQKGVCYWETKG